jgi:hypothetical protein
MKARTIKAFAIEPDGRRGNTGVGISAGPEPQFHNWASTSTSETCSQPSGRAVSPRRASAASIQMYPGKLNGEVQEGGGKTTQLY